MNRAIHAETLKTRLDNDGQLTGYLDEQINDCPTVRPDMNSLVDEMYTDSLVRGVWEDAEKGLDGQTDMRKKYLKRSLCTSMIMQGAEGLVEAVDEIYTAMRKGTHAEYDKAVENYNDAWGKIEATILSCAGYLQIDAEKILRERIEADRAKLYKRRSHAAAGD